MAKFNLPEGYHAFFPGPGGLNFQINRALSLGYIPYEILEKFSKKLTDVDKWNALTIEYAEKSLKENDIMSAGYFYRLAEFFCEPKSSERIGYYNKFIKYFYESIKDEKFEKFEVPYLNGKLPVIYLKTKNPKDTIIIHGGFDSFIEEFFSVAQYIQEKGYDVLLFEGPGQGAAIRKYGLKLTYEWEKPTGAILDYFGLSDVTLIGVSMGGYLCLRAAAYEPRIKRVIPWDHFWDWNQIANSKNSFIRRVIGKFLLTIKAKNTINKIGELAIEKNYRVAWLLNHGMYITGTKDLFEYQVKMGKFNSKKISALIKQDVLVLAGKEDHSQPFENYSKQMKALKHANSVTGRIFTEKEHANQHCQVGNLKLASDVMISWIESKI